MIKSFKISNFYSIGETQEISFDISSKDHLDDSSVKISDKYINLVNCFIGHNASGKTNVLKAITFLFWFINNSYTSTKINEPIPVIATHKLAKKKSIQIEIEFFNHESFFLYRIELNKAYIQKEYLGQKFTRGYTKMFEYTRTDKDAEFDSSKITINKNDLARFKERKTVPMLSNLIETGYLPQLLFLKNFKSNVTEFGHYLQHVFMAFFEVSDALFKDVELQKSSLSFIKDIDLGISNFEFSEVAAKKNNEAFDDFDKKHILECIHEYKDKKFKLPLIQESNGTQHSLRLLSDILPILKTGGVVILDEIESGLHPYVAKKIISLFENPESNPNKAQLIFSTHQHLLLNDRTKTQIFIAEKENNNFETEVFRLDEIEGIRNDENYTQKYLTGTYGGVPHIKWVSE